MARPEMKRACRYQVNWPARVRAFHEADWQAVQVVNLSVSGALLRMERRYRVGERVEVEIDFLPQAESRTVVSGVGHIVRTDRRASGGSAVQFLIECGLSKRSSDAADSTARAELGGQL